MSIAAASNLRTQRRESSRQLILGAAISEFASEGFEAASLARIATRAGVKKALVQYHFATKDNLWKQAVHSLWAQRNTLIPTTTEPRVITQSVQVRAIFEAIVEFSRLHPAWVAFILRESSQPGPRLSWLIDQYLQDDIKQGCQFIEQAQAAGLLPRVSALQLLHLISGALSYNLLVAPMTQQATGTDLSSKASIDEQVDILMQLLGIPS